MRNASVAPADDINGNIQQHQNRNLARRKRYLRRFGPVVAITVIVVCAIVIPVVVTTASKKNTVGSPTISIPENTTSLEMTNSNTVSTTNTTTSTISHILDIQTITSTSTSTENDNNGNTENTDVDATTDTTFIDDVLSITSTMRPNRWTESMITTIKSILNTENTITSTTLRSTTTTVRRMIALNHANDQIVGLYNTVAGRATAGFNGRYHDRESPHKAMDGSLDSKSKYYNFGSSGNSNTQVSGPGIGTGFIVIPATGNFSIACGLLFATADEPVNRDPVTVTLEGSNHTTIDILNAASSWSPIYNGSTGISPTNDPGRNKYVTQQNFNNARPFVSYRLLITSKRAAGDGVQYSEARIMGYILTP